MIDVHLKVPNKIIDLYRASSLRMPLIGEAVQVYYAGVKVGRGKVVAADSKSRLYDIELKGEKEQP
jgi:hypothetical protein